MKHNANMVYHKDDFSLDAAWQLSKVRELVMMLEQFLSQLQDVPLLEKHASFEFL